MITDARMGMSSCGEYGERTTEGRNLDKSTFNARWKSERGAQGGKQESGAFGSQEKKGLQTE